MPKKNTGTSLHWADKAFHYSDFRNLIFETFYWRTAYLNKLNEQAEHNNKLISVYLWIWLFLSFLITGSNAFISDFIGQYWKNPAIIQISFITIMVLAIFWFIWTPVTQAVYVWFPRRIKSKWDAVKIHLKISFVIFVFFAFASYYWKDAFSWVFSLIWILAFLAIIVRYIYLTNIKNYKNGLRLFIWFDWLTANFEKQIVKSLEKTEFPRDSTTKDRIMLWFLKRHQKMHSDFLRKIVIYVSIIGTLISLVFKTDLIMNNLLNNWGFIYWMMIGVFILIWIIKVVTRYEDTIFQIENKMIQKWFFID